MVVEKVPKSVRCWCVECEGKNEWKLADYMVSVGMFNLLLCKSHTWDLSELLDDTTATDFVKSEK